VPKYADVLGNEYEWMHIDPTTAIITDETLGGTMNGIYKYFYTEVYRDSGNSMHTCHETNPSAIYTTGALVNKKVVLTLPATGDNAWMTHLKVYSTDAAGSIYYYIGNVVKGTTSFDDDNITRDATVPFGKLDTDADGVVSQTYLNYPVKNHQYHIATKSRIIACGVRNKTDGTVDVINGNATVDGTTTDWTRAIVGDQFKVDGENRTYTISAFVSSVEITLDETYKGVTNTGLDYSIQGVSDIFRWTAKNPSTAYPMWWAFPVSFYKRIISKDDSSISGINKIGNNPIIFKEQSHYLLTENGDDYIVQESRTHVGTCSHHSIVETGEIGTLIFMTKEGLIYESTGLGAVDLDIDLSRTIDGINKTRLKYVQGRWIQHKKWYMLLYSSEGSTEHDRILVYDYDLKQWVIWAIYGNCLGYIESSEGAQTVYKPWLGTRGAFVYKMLTGYNLGAGTGGDVEGTITGAGATTLTDTGATFYTTGDGLKDIYVSVFDSNGDFVEEKQISSNTANILTVAAWVTTPTVGYTYEVGSIRWYYKSKVFDFEQDESKSIDNVLINFKKVATARNVDVKFYFSNDADMIGDTADQTIAFDLTTEYYEPQGLFDNRFRFCQYEISGHGSADPVVVNNLVLELQQHLR